MPTDSLTAQWINGEELARAFAEAPVETGRYVKTAFFRFSRRVARRTKTQYLKGAPGINGGRWSRISDRNLRGFTTGNDLGSLKAVSKASRIIRTHIEGATIQARTAGGLLYLSRKNGKAGQGKVFARVQSVRIPARIPFASVWESELPKVAEDTLDAAHRAVRAVTERNMKTITSAVQGMLNG